MTHQFPPYPRVPHDLTETTNTKANWRHVPVFDVRDAVPDNPEPEMIVSACVINTPQNARRLFQIASREALCQMALVLRHGTIKPASTVLLEEAIKELAQTKDKLITAEDMFWPAVALGFVLGFAFGGILVAKFGSAF